MFDYFKKHKLTFDRDISEKRADTGEKPKKDKLFIVILIVLAVVLVIGAVTGTGDTADSASVENHFKFSFNISDCIMLGAVIVGYVIMRVRKGRGS